MKKKLKSLCRIIFGRTTMVILSLFVQVMIIFIAVSNLSEYPVIFYIVSILLSTVAIIYIINDNSNTSFKIAWLIPLMLLPVFGTIMYIFVKTESGTRRVYKKLRKIIIHTKPFIRQEPAVLNRLAQTDESEKNLAVYMNQHAFFPVYDNTYAEFFSLGDDNYTSIVKELEKAEKFIFIEYFIIKEGFMWDSILEILKKKASEGIEVRVMYDGMCSITLLPHTYPKRLEKFGIKCKIFSPIKPVLSTIQNNRDHRKILVIDGHTAYTGGVNLADEYINHITRFGHWKDTAIMIKGEAVKSFTMMFLQNWNIYEAVEDDYSKYILEDFTVYNDVSCSGYVIPYSDSPLDNENVGQNVYMNILYNAERYVHIMTPYLILDDEMYTALTFAAKRGVETVIIMPHIPDKQYAYLLARTYYSELISAGVKIYEYTPGFVHAKLFVSDDKRGVVGSINLDYRSLFLHFECAVYLYANKAIADIEADFQSTLKKSQLITLEECKKLNIIKRIKGRIMRIFAPLM